MIIFRRRLIFWLLKAYLRKWGKVIIASFFIGIIGFYILQAVLFSSFARFPISSKVTIGLIGEPSPDSLPLDILAELSSGLVTISPDGMAKPAIAKAWKVQDNGKKYVFALESDIYFTDGTNVTSSDINYNFSDVEKKQLDRYAIQFVLKDSFSPFLVSVARPVFKKELVGVGKYKVKEIKLNGNIVRFVRLVNRSNALDEKMYVFYPNAEALKLGFLLGEVGIASNLQDTRYKSSSLESFKNARAIKKTNHEQLVTLFYNTKDPVLSDKRVRNALSYSIPNEFKQGEKAYSPYPPRLNSYTDIYARKQDIAHAKVLLKAANIVNNQNEVTVVLKVFPKYKHIAQNLAAIWKELGINTKIEETTEVPVVFQLFLGDFTLPKDPDQYSLWHSKQKNNISNFDNKRIDKLLEDGRKTTDLNTRQKIYADFQKYLLEDDPPASFLFFPYEYDLIRKAT